MPGIPNPDVLRIPRLLKDFPVSARSGTRGRRYLNTINPRVTLERLDSQEFGPELATRLCELFDTSLAGENTTWLRLDPRTLRRDRLGEGA
jgi:hypothetical protein